MNKKIWNVIDINFSHDTYTVDGRDSNYILWDRSLENKERPTFYSHIKMLEIDTPKDNAYGLLYESRGIEPYTYLLIEKVIDRFKIVFTHSSELLSKFKNCRWIPGGGIWVGGRLNYLPAEGEIKIQKKSKLVSIVSSNKTMCEGHIVRLAIYNELKNNAKVDKFFATSRSTNNGWIPIFRSLKDYMFSIVVENFIDDLYFTEKILNCFATGTIPVYIGAKKISSLFNPKGIITLEPTKESLKQVMDSLSPDLYNERLQAVQENFELCQKFKCIEDYIYLNYFKD